MGRLVAKLVKGAHKRATLKIDLYISTIFGIQNCAHVINLRVC
ncbi:hypothetical protein PLIP_a0627 [Pseudoalteromonas lipolytica LMEB 39]|nr:hypothetical protein [Pseudoalteromonas lipolytica LMEB 39]